MHKKNASNAFETADTANLGLKRYNIGSKGTK